MRIGECYLSYSPSKDSWRCGDPLLDYIHHQVHVKNKNFLCEVTGMPGSGKSWSCLTMAYLLDKNFSSSNVVFDMERAADMMSRPEVYGLKKGSVVIIEEAGVGMNARNFQSVANKVMNNIAQTFRHLNLVVLFNSPNKKFVDAGIRRLMHASLVAEGHSGGYVRLSFGFNMVDPLSGKSYQRSLILRDQESGSSFNYSRLKICKPPKHLRVDYERRARAYKLKVAGEARTKISMSKNGGKVLSDEEREAARARHKAMVLSASDGSAYGRG